MMCRARLPVLALGGVLVYAAFGFRVLSDSPKVESDARFQRQFLQVAKDYKSWGRVDDEARWAPFLCRMPQPAVAAFSASDDEATHGRKLYSLFAKNRDVYFHLNETKVAPAGQVIVKESWVPEETFEVKSGRGDPDRTKVIRTGDETSGDHFYPYAAKGGQMYKAVKPAGLFIMMKVDAKTPGTDDGWVYGTVSADGTTVTAAGKIESCMKCHVDAKYDRQFGLAAK